MMRSVFGKLSLCLLLLAACGEDDDQDVDRQIDGSTPFERDAGMDARVEPPQDAALDANPQWLDEAPNLTVCPSGTEQCLRGETELWSVLLEASRFGVDAQFESLGEGAVVVHGGSAARWQVARLVRAPQAGAPQVETWAAPANVAALIDALDTQADPGRVHVLACPEEELGCSLLVGITGSSELTPVPGGTVPRQLRELRGLRWDAADARLCVFGSGLLCFEDGAWSTSIEPADDVSLRDLSLEQGLGMAVGAGGAVWTSRREGAPRDRAWLRLWRRGSADLSEVSAAGNEALIRGGTALWSWSHGSDALCRESPALSAAWTAPGGLTQVLALDGRLLSYEPSGSSRRWCMVQQLPQLEVVASGSAPCGSAPNPRVLTRTQLLGQNVCRSE